MTATVKVVPLEPTNEMLMAGYMAVTRAIEDGPSDMPNVWAAMLAAAPSYTPLVDVDLPDGDTREVKVRWLEWKDDRLMVCISVGDNPPKPTGNLGVLAMQADAAASLGGERHLLTTLRDLSDRLLAMDDVLSSNASYKDTLQDAYVMLRAYQFIVHTGVRQYAHTETDIESVCAAVHRLTGHTGAKS